ncbi:hypothetical protein [Candidatus Vidania fulgoroideorum]
MIARDGSAFGKIEKYGFFGTIKDHAFLEKLIISKGYKIIYLIAYG